MNWIQKFCVPNKDGNTIDPLVSEQVSRDLEYFIQMGYHIEDNLPDIDSSAQDN